MFKVNDPSDEIPASADDLSRYVLLSGNSVLRRAVVSLVAIAEGQQPGDPREFAAAVLQRLNAMSKK